MAQLEYHNPTLRQRIQHILHHEVTGLALQFAKGAMIAAAGAIGGIPGALIAGGTFALIGIAKAYTGSRYRQEQLLELYKDDLSLILHKDKNALRIGDLKQAASLGGKENAISLELKALAHNTKHYLLCGLLTTAALTASVIGLIGGGIIDPATLDSWLGNSMAGATGNLVNAMTGMTLAPFTGGRAEYHVNREIGSIRQQLKHRAVTPEHVFAVFVEANKPLKQEIRSRYGQPYQDLSLSTKRQILEAHDAHFGIHLLTEALNQDKIRPSALGFIAYGQEISLATPFTLTMPNTASEEGTATSQHAQRILAQKMAGCPSRAVH